MRGNGQYMQGECGGVGAEDEGIAGEGEVAEDEIALKGDGVDGVGACGGGARKGGVAVEDEDGIGLEDWLEEAGLGGGKADGDEALAGGAACAVLGAQAGECCRGDLDAIGDGGGADEVLMHGDVLRDEGDAARVWGGWGSGLGEQIGDAEIERSEDAVEGGDTESPTAAEEVGDVRLLHAGFSSEQGGGEHLALNAAKQLRSQSLVQLGKVHFAAHARELWV